MRTRTLPALGAVLLSTTSLAAQGIGLKEGRYFPDLRLPTLADGKPRSVSEYRGRKTLVVLFGSW